MRFQQPLIKAHLIKRYKRFLADASLMDGQVITAHCANPGAMTGLKQEGMEIYLSKSDNPKRKLPYSWELATLSHPNPTFVGINTARPNPIVEEALIAKNIAPLKDYSDIKREVPYGTKSRIDFLLRDKHLPDCYLEVKNVHLVRQDGLAEFPDSVTKRGTKHLGELQEMVSQGHRAVMLYLIQRSDCKQFSLAKDIDPAYADAFEKALAAGVEAYAYSCTLNLKEISLSHMVPIIPPKP